MAELQPLAARPRASGWPVVSWLATIWRQNRTSILMTILVLVLGFMVIYPIGSVVISSFLDDTTGAVTLGAWQGAFLQPGMLQSVLNTVKVVSAVQLIALPIAVGIAWLLARTNVPFSRSIEFGFWILFFLPSLGITTGWLLLFDSDYGLANRWLIASGIINSAIFNMYSFWGIVFAHLTSFAVAVKVMLLTPAFRNLDGAIEEASRVCGAGAITTLIRIVIPILAPAIVVVVLMSIIRGLESFEIELFLGTPIGFSVYSTKIYSLMANDPPQFAQAGVLATIILLLMLPLIVLQRWVATRRSYVVLTGQRSSTKTDLGRWRWPIFGGLIAIVGFFSLVPLTLLVMGSFMKLFGFFDLPNFWTLQHWRELFVDDAFFASFQNMLILGLATAALAVIVYSVVSYCTVRIQNRLRAPLDILTWLPLTIPGIILSFGYLYMVLQVPIFSPLYGTLAVMVLVGFLGAMTLGVQILKVHMLQIGAEVEEAGRVVGGSWIRTFRSIITPLSLPALVVVGVMVFAGAIRQVSSIILLVTGETRVLSILQLEFLTEGFLAPGAVVGSVIVAISLTAAVLVRTISARFGVQSRGG